MLWEQCRQKVRQAAAGSSRQHEKAALALRVFVLRA